MPKRDLVMDQSCANANHQVRTSLLFLLFFLGSSFYPLLNLYSLLSLNFGAFVVKKKKNASSSSHDLMIHFQP